MNKSLDERLANILRDSAAGDFVLADAKDADMGLGVAAPGPRRSADAARPTYRALAEYRQQMRDIVEQGLVDIMLMSASSNEILTIEERIFDDSPVTPAVRANDTTDIWVGHTGSYTQQPSLPFRTTTIDHIQCGHLECDSEQRRRGADLGLYSVTFNNDAELDRRALDEYRDFRHEAESKGLRHFLEVFAPNAPRRELSDVGRYVNDCIVRCLAGVTRAGRPLFLKMPFFGEATMQELVSYDPTLIVGVLGGSAGTTHDAFHLLAEAKRCGARVALFGRKINHAEDQLTFVRMLRAVADEVLDPADAVREYHAALAEIDIVPKKRLDEDLQLAEAHH